jgi:hypothetical protein
VALVTWVYNNSIFIVKMVYIMAKTISEGFDTFLGWLVPLATEHEKASSHKDSVFSCLKKNFECTRLFETGSFGNGTGIRHYSDTDYFASIPNGQLYSSSAYTLRKVKEALQETFWNTDGIIVNTPAVMLPFGNYASESLEVTPCSFKGLTETPLGEFQAYNIADGNDGWMLSSPGAHNAYVQKHDDRLNGKLKPLIRFIKAWKYYNNVPISSFYLELRVTKYAEDETSIIYDIDIKRVMKMLHDKGLASIQDPMNISGYVNPCASDSKKDDALSKLATGHGRSEKAYEEREKDIDKAFYWWNMFFNNEFPGR